MRKSVATTAQQSLQIWPVHSSQKLAHAISLPDAMQRLAHHLCLRLPGGPPRDGVDAGAENSVQDVLRAWHAKSQRVQVGLSRPHVRSWALALALQAFVDRVRGVCNAQLGAHI
jgi:hypothetical protein